MCALDFSILEVSIAEKISLWHALLTPGKQMCRTGQALKPRSIVVVANPQLWSSSHWGAEWLCEIACVRVNWVVHWRVHTILWALLWFITQNLSRPPLWCRCHVVSIRLWCDGESTRARASLPCWDQNLHVCISSPPKNFRLPVPENAGYSRLVWS